MKKVKILLISLLVFGMFVAPMSIFAYNECWHSSDIERDSSALAYAFELTGFVEIAETIESLRANAQTTTIPLWRMYHRGINQHLWTTCSNEYNVLATRGWDQEGVAWMTPNAGRPVHRLFHPGIIRHHYTADQHEIRVLTAERGWQDEGVLFFCAYGEDNGVQKQRLYHSGALKHLHTADLNEVFELQQQGWALEGISFYGYNDSSKTFVPWRSLSIQEERQIKEDFLVWRRSHEEFGYQYDGFTTDDVVEFRHINTYNSGVVVAINTEICFFLRGNFTTDVWTEVIGGHKFELSHERSISTLFYNPETLEFMTFRIAYERGLLSNAELGNLARRMAVSW